MAAEDLAARAPWCATTRRLCARSAKAAVLCARRLLTGFEDIDDVVTQSEADSRRAPYLEKARRDLAEREPDRIRGLAALRLRKGWSQKRLATEVGTSQPHIARLEMGHEDLRMEIARRLAAALEVSIADIDAAFFAREQQG